MLSKPGLSKQLLKQLTSPSQFTRYVGSTFATQVITLVAATLNGALVARWLGAEGKGVVQLALLAPSMLGLFLSCGIGVANVQFLGTKRYDVATLTANAFAFALLASALGALLLTLLFISGWVAILLPGIQTGFLLIALLGLPLTLLIGYLATIVQGLQHITVLNRINLLVVTINLASTVLFVIVFRWAIPGALGATLFSNLLNVFFLGRHLRRYGGVWRPRWQRTVMRDTLFFGLRGHAGNIFQFYNYRLDVFLVNFYLGAASVGIYGVAARMAELVWNFPNAVSFVILPKAATSSAQTMNAFTPRVFRITLAITAAAGVGLATVGRPLISLIYSADFSSAYLPMLILLPGVILLGAGRVLTNDIAGRGYPEYNSINSGISLVITIVFDLLLIPRWGILGASAASTISYVVTFLSALLFYRRVSRHHTRPPLQR
ncbi:MAG: polysaccharide biosynthesis C-terminal domain-containing protein [Caldilineaceae bacterium]